MTHRPRTRPIFLVIVLSLIFTIPTAALAVIWTETGDAGDLVDTAQVTSGAGGLTHINGSISILPDHVDMYCISIPDPDNFYAIIYCQFDTDPDLWLFDQNGNGIAMEDVCGAGVVALTPDYVMTPGPYFIAVSANNDEAQSATGSIWDPAGIAAQRAPDGAGAGDPLTSWTNSFPLPAASYSISLIGAETCDNVVATEGAAWGTLKSTYR